MPDIAYYIDRFELLFGQETGIVASCIDIDGLRRISRGADLLTMPSRFQYNRYKSKLTVEGPTPETLQRLIDSTHTLTYWVTYIEVARDRACLSKTDAEHMSEKTILHVTKKNTGEVFIFDGIRYPDTTLNTSNTDEGLFALRTGYFGKKGFQYVVYARVSNYNHLPCLHCEWRVRGAANVRRCFNIRRINDMLRTNLQERFETLRRRFISYEEIDHDRHGRFLNRMRANAQHPGVIREGDFAGGNRPEPKKASNQFLRAHAMISSAELRVYYYKLKQDANKKRRRGTELTPWEEKVRRMSFQRLNSFFRTVENPEGV